MDCVEKRMNRHRGRNRKLEAVIRISEIVAISHFLLSHYSSGVSAAGEFLQRLVCLSSKRLHVFFISNVIVLAVAVLSGSNADSLRMGDGKKRRGRGVTDGIYDEYVAHCRVIAARGNYLEVSSGGVDVPEDKKHIVLFSSSRAPAEEGKGSRIEAAASSDLRTKNGCPRRGMKAEKFTDVASPRRRGRLVLHGDDGGHSLGAPAAAAGDGGVSNSPPEMFTKEASPHRRARLALPDIIGEHTLEVSSAAASAHSMTEKHVVLKSLSKATINGEKDLPTVAITVGHGGAKSSLWKRAMEAEEHADIPSPYGRGTLVVVRDRGSKMVEDMSNDEFNRNVEKYIAKTRRFLREESMREIDFDTLYRDRSADQSIRSRRSY